MKRIFIVSIVILISIITCIFILTGINTSSNGSPWVCLDNTESNDIFLGIAHGFGPGPGNYSLFLNVNRIYVYDWFDRSTLLNTIIFPGEFIDYKLNYSDTLSLIIKTGDRLRLLEYSIGGSDIHFRDINDIECEYFIDGEIIFDGYYQEAIQSKNKTRIQLPGIATDYTLKKPIVVVGQFFLGVNSKNLVFDGDRVFDLFKPNVDVFKFDYTGFEKEHAKLDFTKKVILGSSYFYNNDLLVLLDPKTHKITSIKTLKNVLNIYQVSNENDEPNKFFKYLTKDGLYLYDGTTSIKLKEFTNLIELNECKPTLQKKHLLYAIYDGSYSRIFDFDFNFENTNNKDFKFDYTLTEVGSVPGKIMGFWKPNDLYVHTTKGVYEYPDYELRGLK